uniref:SFRICE_005965 n=1 Tax=Spodoptera frugiperda TaxID=7108 RepID=A0A2H1W8V6_SPOFR
MGMVPIHSRMGKLKLARHLFSLEIRNM